MLWDIIDLTEEKKLNDRFGVSELQSPFLFRALYRARKISKALIDEKGDLSLSLLKKLIKDIDSSPLPFYPQGENDHFVVTHFFDTLVFFLENRSALSLLSRFQLPFINQYVRELVEHSVALSFKEKITVAHLRRAVLSALLTPLRQNVGSCFATAPAILIQREQRENLLNDLYDLMMTCTLKRTFGGEEYAVPISPSWGRGDLGRSIDFLRNGAALSPSVEEALTFAGLALSDCPKGHMSVEVFIRKALQKKNRFPASLEKIALLEKGTQAIFKRWTDHPLLKAWEFTLASFSDYKVEFYRWNLYSSLGFDPKDAGGIGALLYHKIEKKLEEANEEIEASETEYRYANDRVEAIQAFLRTAGSEERANRLKSELQAGLNHRSVCKEKKAFAENRALNLSRFFNFLLAGFARYFPDYFQEIYDAKMFDIQGNLYDDRPAGFRLFFKHGRADPTAWTPIVNAIGYQRALIAFFIAIEPLLIEDCEWKEGKNDIADLIASLIHHLQTEEFILSAIRRMARRHHLSLEGDPLTFLERIEKKPWSYTSGGTVHSLLKCYYCIENELEEEKKSVANPMELFIFLLDTLKGLPPSTVCKKFFK